MSWRKFGVLVSQLPAESATATRLRVDTPPSPSGAHDPEAEQWSRTEHLIASVRDEIHALRHNYIQAHSKSKLQWNPEPLARPGVKSRKAASALSPEQVDHLAEHLAKTQGTIAS